MTVRSSRLTTVVALSVAALALSSGGAVAGTLITGAQIKNGTVTTKDVKNRSLRTVDLSPATVRGLRTPGARGPAGPAGTPGLVRAFGRVAADGTVTQGSAGTVVTRPQTGIYCLAVPGVSPATTVAVVSPDYEFGGTGVGPNNSQSFVEYGGASSVCPVSAISVRTFVRLYTVTGGVVSSTNLQADNQPFTFVVP